MQQQEFKLLLKPVEKNQIFSENLEKPENLFSVSRIGYVLQQEFKPLLKLAGLIENRITIELIENRITIERRFYI